MLKDMHRASHCTNPITFRDDTDLLESSKNMKTLFKTMNVLLIKICEWLKRNKLSINIDKTNFILFHPRKANKSLTLNNDFFLLMGLKLNKYTQQNTLRFKLIRT